MAAFVIIKRNHGVIPTAAVVLSMVAIEFLWETVLLVTTVLAVLINKINIGSFKLHRCNIIFVFTCLLALMPTFFSSSDQVSGVALPSRSWCFELNLSTPLPAKSLFWLLLKKLHGASQFSF